MRHYGLVARLTPQARHFVTFQGHHIVSSLVCWSWWNTTLAPLSLVPQVQCDATQYTGQGHTDFQVLRPAGHEGWPGSRQPSFQFSHWQSRGWDSVLEALIVGFKLWLKHAREKVSFVMAVFIPGVLVWDQM